MEVRGVGAGGVVSTPYCCLYRLFTMKLTRKQLYHLLDHPDSPYIRGLGFIYIRYTQAPDSFWEWYEPYLEDEEEVDPKAGGMWIVVRQLALVFMILLSFKTKILTLHGIF